MIVAMQAGPVYAGDMVSDINFLKYTSGAVPESGVDLLENFEEHPGDADEADLEEDSELRKQRQTRAEYAAGETARGYAHETESSERVWNGCRECGS